MHLLILIRELKNRLKLHEVGDFSDAEAFGLQNLPGVAHPLAHEIFFRGDRDGFLKKATEVGE